MKSVEQAYRAGTLKKWIRLMPTDLELAHSESRTEIDRTLLAEAFRAYHSSLGTLDSTTQTLLERLQHPASRTVVTGQQAGLLGGPAYSVHKAADAILLARQLDTPDQPVVAVYWVASQDHDAAEVASTTLLDHSEELHRLTLNLPEGVPIGRIQWQANWTQQIETLLETFDTQDTYKTFVRDKIKKALASGGSYADVFARLIHHLLAKEGLLILDPLHPAFAKLMAPSLAHELKQPLASSQKIEEAAQQLQAQGFTPQLRRPAGATNLFLEEADGQRRLLHYQQPIFQTDNNQYSQQELLELLNTDPSRLTPAAGLRPVVQDTLLPTLAFVVGPGEVAYGAQLQEVYKLHGLQQPLLWPRLSVTWLEPNVQRLLNKLNLTVAELQKNPEKAYGQAIAKQQNAASLSATRLTELEQQFNILTTEIEALDPTLVKATKRTQHKTLQRFERLQQLGQQALARAENQKSQQLTRLKTHLLPNGHKQEREMNFLTYLLKHGDTPLKMLLACPAGWHGDLKIP